METEQHNEFRGRASDDNISEEDLVRSVRAALGVIGGKWKLLILANLVGGTRRYGELKRAIPEATEKVLIQQLRELESDGLVKRQAYPTIPPKVEYSFTDYGYSICTVMHALHAWGYNHNLHERASQGQDGNAS